MRRRLGALIPIVLLAVLVQLIAPIAAFRVAANAVSDPLYFASICSEIHGDSQTAPAKMEHDSGTCCAVCTAGLAGTPAVDPPPFVYVALQRQYQLLSWLEAADPMAAIRIGSNAQAPAPPSIS
jgi:hypothetical protein